MNGKESSGNRTRHFDIKLVYVTNMIENKEAEARYCSTEDMLGDYMAKPVVGTKFTNFRE